MSLLEDRFKEHFAALRKVVEENRYSSFFDHIFGSPDFQAIVAMGKADESSFVTIKLLFEDLLQKNTWETVLALSAILDYQPEAESVGIFKLLNFSQICQELISIGKKLGHI